MVWSFSPMLFSCSVGNGPSPTRVWYALTTPKIFLIAVGGIPRPVQAPPTKTQKHKILRYSNLSCGVRRGNVGIGAKVKIQQGPVSTFNQNILFLIAEPIQKKSGVDDNSQSFQLCGLLLKLSRRRRRIKKLQSSVPWACSVRHLHWFQHLEIVSCNGRSECGNEIQIHQTLHSSNRPYEFRFWST